ncbi:MAG: YpdA family putative bacillithiol disulfide reductase [Bryobacterales bacterium]
MSTDLPFESDQTYDMLVVGAGPTGLACAIEAQKRGLNAVVIEKGCLVNSLYHYPDNLTFFTTPELLEIGDIPMTSVREKPNRTEALKYYRRVAQHYRLDVRHYERVDAITGDDGSFVAETTRRSGERRRFRARKIVLATGFYDIPVRMGVPGEDLDKVLHYYEDPHPFYDCDVAVVGGKNSAAIYALECYRAGARVTLIHRYAALSPKIKYWILPDIENRIKNGEITAYFESEVESIGPTTITIRTLDGVKTIANDFVLAMTGYQPDLEFLSATGIELDPATRKPRTDPDTLESDRSGVYLAGVIVAGMHTNEIFIENGRFHGGQIAADVASKLGKA